jgi:hypothetical protein
LDALIQLDAQISPELIQLIYEWGPAQALILQSKNRGNVHQILLELMHRENGLRWFAAANMALERKSSGLGIALLKEMELVGTLVLAEVGHAGIGAGRGDGGGMGVGCGAGAAIAPGLPPWASYELTPFARPCFTVLSPGPIAIYYERAVAPAGQTPVPHVLSIGGPSTPDRLNYVAALAGFEPSQLPLSGHEQYAFAGQGDASVTAELARIRQDLGARYAQLLQMLVVIRA